MTNAERDAQFLVRWNGGPLLPAYESNTTLTEPARDHLRRRDEFGDVRSIARYTPEQKARARGMYLAAMPAVVIARELSMPVATVKHWLVGLAAQKAQPQDRGAVGKGTVLSSSGGRVAGGRPRHDNEGRQGCSGLESASL